MFFFFAGGVEQQVREIVKSGVGRCINCGSKADVVEYERVLKLFFIPVWRWPGKEPALYCDSCKFFFPQSDHDAPEFDVPDRVLRCRFCDRDVRPEYRFCPFCGASV